MQAKLDEYEKDGPPENSKSLKVIISIPKEKEL